MLRSRSRLGRASMFGGVNLCSSSALLGLARFRLRAPRPLFARFAKPLVRWYVVQLLSIVYTVLSCCALTNHPAMCVTQRAAAGALARVLRLHAGHPACTLGSVLAARVAVISQATMYI